jgi:hypothetical protein
MAMDDCSIGKAAAPLYRMIADTLPAALSAGTSPPKVSKQSQFTAIVKLCVLLPTGFDTRTVTS